MTHPSPILARRPLPLLVLLWALALLAGLGTIDGPTPAAAQEGGTVKAQFGDWQHVCRPPPPGAKNEVCGLTQSVTDEDRSNVGLSVQYQIYPNGKRILRIFAPTGVLLTKGVHMKIDDKDLGGVPFVRCPPLACIAQIEVDDKLLDLMKTGKTALFIIFQTEEAGIGIPISLAGFDKALASLK
ncbi:MAG: invasion associated locus B family protein [Hyphomicrobiaceae bacterium]